MNKSLSKKWSIIITIILIIALGYFLYTNLGTFAEIKKINPIYVIPISILILFSLYINGVFIKLLTIPFNIELKEHFKISLAASFLNLITPFRGGAGFRALYMKKKYDLSYSKFMSSLFGNYIIIFLVSSTLGLITFAAVYFLFGFFSIIMTLIFATILISTIILIKFDLKIKKENFITTKINKLLEGWNIISKDKKIILYLTILAIANTAIMAIINKLTFAGLGINIEITKAFYLAIIGTLAIFINITPGSLGITESFYMISAKILNISPGIGLLVALIIRAINMAILLVAGPTSHYLLLKKQPKQK